MRRTGASTYTGRKCESVEEVHSAVFDPQDPEGNKDVEAVAYFRPCSNWGTQYFRFDTGVSKWLCDYHAEEAARARRGG